MKYLIWSNEHNSWWMPNSSGYTQRSQYAGRYTLEEAIRICNGANYGWDADTVRKIPMELPVSEETAILLEYQAGGERCHSEGKRRIRMMDRLNSPWIFLLALMLFIALIIAAWPYSNAYSAEDRAQMDALIDRVIAPDVRDSKEVKLLYLYGEE